MEETLPVGLYTHWGEGEGDMIAAGTRQMEDFGGPRRETPPPEVRCDAFI